MKLFLKVLPFLVLVSCSSRQDIVILYDNDAHCAVDGYAKMAALRKDMAAGNAYVSVVSAGDYVQGSVVGSISKGEYVVEIMNAVPYDVVTLGNHEFDYTIPQQKTLTDQLRAVTVCCNFSRINEDESIYPGYTIKRYGRTKVAFVGAATPTTFTSSTPTYFTDSAGNVLYDFHAGDTFERIERTAAEARREGADYVVLLSHLGDDTNVDNSVDMIAATSGIDVVLDGHQHHVIPCRKIVNAQGDTVLLSSTGTAFEHIGKLTIGKDGKITTELIRTDEYSERDSSVVALIDSIKEQLSERVNRKIGYCATGLSINDANGERLIRREEAAIGNFVADAFRFATGADIGVLNGGGIRTSFPAGDITYGQVLSVLPFNNAMHVVEATGQQLLDAMEVSLATYPEENGDYQQISGLRFTFDPQIPSSVILDENRLFAGVGKTRRITSMDVLRVSASGEEIWEPICKDSVYTIGGQSYILTSKGSSGMYAMMKESSQSPLTPDVDAIAAYIHYLGDTIPTEKYSKPEGRIIVAGSAK